MGKFLEVRLAETQRAKAEQVVEELCQKLLANPVIEEYRYHLEEITQAPKAGTR